MTTHNSPTTELRAALAAVEAISQAVACARIATDKAVKAAHAQMLRMQDAHGANSPEAIAAEAIYDAAAEARAAVEAIAVGEVA